jgi:hypothetical protein
MASRLLITTTLFFCSILSFGQQFEGTGYLAILKRAGKYNIMDHNEIPNFEYQTSHNKNLVALRNNFNLDSIAGFGNEASRLLNLLHWVHNSVSHDGQHESGIKKINAKTILDAVRTKHIGVSCGELATTLNDCYLAMGWASRKIYCFPKDSLNNDDDSHVLDVVFLSSKKKWIWVDPTNDAYVMDEKGELLSIEEVRERLITNMPLIVNPDANWNHRNSMTKDYYLDIYMAKNLYRLYCPLKSEFDYETESINKSIVYITLLPLDYHKKTNFKTHNNDNPALKRTFYNIYNPDIFWQSPKDE